VRTPYYADDLATLYLGDCREITDWLAADVLVTDPPYGRGWRQGQIGTTHRGHPGIANDGDTSVRDVALAAWGADRCAVVFGDLMLPPPVGNKQTMVFGKPSNAGLRGAMGGFRRDAEAVYLLGPWPTGIGGRSSIITTGAVKYGHGGPSDRYGHPHAKPVDVMETLISACPDGTIADPFAGSGSSLVAARNLGRSAIGIEIDEKYCEQAARRLSQMTLDLEAG
jgi:site-specific DNA-methyltransferase (adenine-specific)